MSSVDFRSVFVKGCLCLGVVFQHFVEILKVIEKVLVGEMAAGDIL